MPIVAEVHQMGLVLEDIVSSTSPETPLFDFKTTPPWDLDKCVDKAVIYMNSHRAEYGAAPEAPKPPAPTPAVPPAAPPTTAAAPATTAATPAPHARDRGGAGSHCAGAVVHRASTPPCEVPREVPQRLNCASNATALGAKSRFRTNRHASRAPCSRSIAESSHSTDSGPS